VKKSYPEPTGDTSVQGRKAVTQGANGGGHQPIGFPGQNAFQDVRGARPREKGIEGTDNRVAKKTEAKEAERFMRLQAWKFTPEKKPKREGTKDPPTPDAHKLAERVASAGGCTGEKVPSRNSVRLSQGQTNIKRGTARLAMDAVKFSTTQS